MTKILGDKGISKNAGKIMLAGLLAMGWSASSSALMVQIDSLSLYKNKSLLFEDNFDNGLTPAQEPATYTVFGTIPNGSEAGGKLALDSAWGGMTTNALGQTRQTLNVTGLTGLNSANPTSLGRNDLISVVGVFDAVNPVGPFNNGYGVVLREGGPTGVISHSLSLQVGYSPASGQSLIRFFDQNFVTGTLTILAEVPFTLPVGADQIGLELSNEDTLSTSFQAWYSFSTGGVWGPGFTFAVTDPMFTTSDFVRAQVQVYSAVPEPSGWALSGIGLLGLARLARGGKRRRLAIPV